MTRTRITDLKATINDESFLSIFTGMNIRPLNMTLGFHCDAKL